VNRTGGVFWPAVTVIVVTPEGEIARTPDASP
jgi:hypothetical protein